MKRIVICDEDEKNVSQLRQMIENSFPQCFQINGYISSRQLLYEIEDNFLKEVDLFFVDLGMEDIDGIEVAKIWTNKEYQIILNYQGCGKKNEEVKFVIGITRADGTYCYGTSMKLTQLETENLKSGYVKFIFENKLLKGKYMLDLWIENTAGVQYDSIYSLMQIEVDTDPYDERGILTMEHHWKREEN